MIKTVNILVKVLKYDLTLSWLLTPIGVIVFDPSAVPIGASSEQINYTLMKSNQFRLI